MGQASQFSLSIHNAARFYLGRLRERLWLKPAVICLLSIVAAFAAGLVDNLDLKQPVPDISLESIKTLLSIMSASMLVIAVFAVGAMLSAYSSASNAATPRSFHLVVADDVSQNALSTFIGAFIFSIVALVAILNGFYEETGRFVLFLVTIFVFAVVILNFVRWVDRIARLGRLGNTIDKVEKVADAALGMRARHPTLGARKLSGPVHGISVYAEQIGYVQRVNVAKLQAIAEQADRDIAVCALPGTFTTPDKPLACLPGKQGEVDDEILKAVADAFVIGGERTFEDDPRFGLIVLAEIASRALSPAVNDSGTAVDITGTLVRLFVHWVRAQEANDDPPVEYERILVPGISVNDMLDDAFNTIARDGAASLEVAIRLQKAFQTLAQLGHEELRQASTRHAELAFAHAQQSLKLEYEIETLRSVANQNAGNPVDEARE